MRRFAAAAALVIGMVAFGGTAAAGTDDPYPNEQTPAVTTSSATVTPGGTFTASVTNCENGETVTFSFQGSTQTAVCVGSSASVSFPAPTAPGTYTVTASMPSFAGTVTTTITVVAATTPPTNGGGTPTPAPGIPATGNSTTTTVTAAAILLAAGIGLFYVSQMRRNKTAAA